jgi:hypothetical protein
MHDLGIIIVNWNTRDLLRKCLQTVYASTSSISYEVVVVDNASEDGSAEMVEREFPLAQIIKNKKNHGYPAANNQGLRTLRFPTPGSTIVSGTPRYALLLNPDTELPPRALDDLVVFMDNTPEAGVVGPKLILPDGSLDLACRRSFPSPEVSFWRMTGLSRLFPRSRLFGRYNLTYLPADETAEVDSVVGACMAVRASAIYKIGLMDEKFFMYGEDLDWCKRIKEHGKLKVIYYPKVVVKHVKRAASRQSEQAKFEFVRAMLLFYNKHYRQSTHFLVHLLVLLGIALQGGPKLWPEIAGKAGGEAHT